MKHKFRFLSLFLALVFVISAFSLPALAEEPEGYAEQQEVVEIQDEVLTEDEFYEGTGSLEYAFDGTFVRDYVDNEVLDEAGHVARIPEEEALDTYVFLNRDGTKSVYYMDDNVRYVDENGEKVEKDLSIVRKNKGYSLKASDVKLWFPDVLSDGISVKYDKYHLTLFPQGVADTEEVVIDEYERITYPGVFGENTVLAYTPTLSGLKEDIILSEYTGQLSFDFLIHTHGMRILMQDGKWIVKKPGNGNKETFELGAVQIYDSAGNFCVGEMTVTEQNNGSKYILTLTAPEEFLTDPDTVYPVTVDPTISVSDNLTGANAIEDSVLYSGTPAVNYGGFTYLTVGYNGTTYGIGRAIFRLPGLYNSELYNSLSSSQILSVTFHTWDASGHDSLPIEVRANVHIPWTESEVKWNNAPGGYPGLSPVTAYMPSGDFACFDITTIVEWWKAGNSPQGGLTMMNPNETSELYKKVPCSSETAITDRRPYVIMTYTTELEITSATNYVPGGGSTLLSVTSDEEIQSVEWSSSNQTIAYIDTTGRLYGNSVGRAVITATVTFADGTTQTAQQEIYVIFPYNVIRIKNNNSNLFLNVDQGRINDFSKVTQLSSTANEDTPQEIFQQTWKIKYIGDGMYTIRPYHKLDMCLYSYGANNYSYIRKYTKDGSTDQNDPDYVIAGYRWSIEYINGGYVIKNNGESASTLQIENGSTAQNAQARTQAYANSANCRWTFSIIYNPKSGVILYDTKEQKQITPSSKTLYLAPEEELSLAGLGVCAAMYSPTKINQTFAISEDSAYIELTSEGKVKGVKYSLENSASLVLSTNALASDNTISLTVKVTAIPNSTYYIQNKKTKQYIDIDNSADDGDSVKMDAFEYYDYQQWTFTHTGNGYYTICNTKQPDLYMRVDEDSIAEGTDIVVSTDSVTDGALWKIQKLNNGSFTFSPKNGVNTNRVAVVYERPILEDTVELEGYVEDDAYIDEWELYNLVISMVNYYDSSFNNDLIENIEFANKFVTDLYEKQFEISIKMDGVAIHLEDARADECTETGCCEGNCSNSDGQHCKDVFVITDDLLNAPRENNHIYILWANREKGTYCQSTAVDNNEDDTFYGFACVPFTEPRENLDNYRRDYKPAVFVATIPGESIEEQKKAMCIILAHEIAHTLSMPEVYTEVSDHTAYFGDFDCIMDEYENENYDLSHFYNDVYSYIHNDGDTFPFCEDCELELKSCLAINEPISRTEE